MTIESAPGRIRVGTRGSPLARIQTGLACSALVAADPALAAPGALETVVIRTTGDAVTDRPLADLGGKGLFCKELEAALLERRIDLAVHSVKDLPTWLPDGLVLAAILPREDPRDVLIGRTAGGDRRAAAGGGRRQRVLAPAGPAARAPARPAGREPARQRRHAAAQARRRRGRCDASGAGRPEAPRARCRTALWCCRSR